MAAAFLLLSGLAAPASARAVIKITPASFASDLSHLTSPLYFFSSYRISLPDLAAGTELSDRFALAGGFTAVEYSGLWWSYDFGSPTTVLSLPVYAYLLMALPAADDLSALRSYLLLGTYLLAIPRYHAVVGTAGLGANWTFYVATVSAEFRTPGLAGTLSTDQTDLPASTDFRCGQLVRDRPQRG